MEKNKYKIKVEIAKNEHGEDVLIEDVKKHTKYYCYDCNCELIPRRGEKNQYHYSHKSNANCSGESWQHKYCKRIISHYLQNIKFIVECDKCNAEHMYTYDSQYSSFEEYKYKEYHLDLGITIKNNLSCAIEVLHKHKVERIKQEDIIYNDIDFIEIKTKYIFSVLDDLKNSKNVTIKCENVSVCNKCENYTILRQISHYTNKHNDFFQNIDIDSSVIKLEKCKFLDMLYDNIKFIYSLNNRIKKELQRRDFSIDGYLLTESNIFAGSFICNIFLKCLSKFDSTIKCDWEFNDIDIWLYDENGLQSINIDQHNSMNYLDAIQHSINITLSGHSPFETNPVNIYSDITSIITSDNDAIEDKICDNDAIGDNNCYKEELILNYIKTPHAKNNKELLYSFDIPCCQIAFRNKICYLTPKCFYSLITGKNIFDINVDINNQLLLEYTFSNHHVFDTNENSVFDSQFIKFDKNDSLDKNYIPEYPILCNVNTDIDIFNLLQNNKKTYEGLNCSYTQKDEAKHIGAKWDCQDKKWILPNYVSISKFAQFLNNTSNTKINITTDIKNWNDNIFLISTTNPIEFWALISIFSNHNQPERRLCAEILNENILLDDAVKILYLSGVDPAIIYDLDDECMLDHHGGWGCKLEQSKIITTQIDQLLNNPTIRKVIAQLRLRRRIQKYQDRRFSFVYS